MEYLKVAIKAARAAGGIHKKYFRGDFKVKAKSVSYDLLTVVDTRAQEAAVEVIKKYFPGHNFLAEESGYKRTPSGYTWIIDPLDGTNNFVCGIPIFCSSVALRHNDEIIAGAIYDAVRGELFYARKGAGAFLNGKPIRVNAVTDLRQAMLITGFYYSRGKDMLQTLEAMKKFFFRRVLGIRRFGAAALDLCYVACGRAAGYWEYTLSPWDFAAGKLFVEEAGGRVSGRHGEALPLDKKHFIVASNSRIHQAMLSVLNRKDVRHNQ